MGQIFQPNYAKYSKTVIDLNVAVGTFPLFFEKNLKLKKLLHAGDQIQLQFADWPVKEFLNLRTVVRISQTLYICKTISN